MNDALTQAKRLCQLSEKLEGNYREMVEQLEALSRDLKSHNREMARKLSKITGDTSPAK